MNTDPEKNINRESLTEENGYLWNRSEPRDERVARLERVLGMFRHTQQSAPAPFRAHRMRFAVLAVAASAAMAAGIGWMMLRADAASLEVQMLAGQPKVGAASVSGVARLKVGQWLETDGTSRASIAVADIGRVTVEPGSRIRLVRTQQAEHRLNLDRGGISAFITAPPRLFFVDTPSAVAIDYGCAYTLNVDDDGSGLLRVTLGLVMLEGNGRQATVPRDAMCRTKRGTGPGTPFSCNSSEALRQALKQFDFESGGDAALDTALRETGKTDIVTLWHLLPRANQSQRGRVFDRLAAFVAPPSGVTRDGVIALDQVMLDLWQSEVQAIW